MEHTKETHYSQFINSKNTPNEGLNISHSIVSAISSQTPIEFELCGKQVWCKKSEYDIITKSLGIKFEDILNVTYEEGVIGACPVDDFSSVVNVDGYLMRINYKGFYGKHNI